MIFCDISPEIYGTPVIVIPHNNIKVRFMVYAGMWPVNVHKLPIKLRIFVPGKSTGINNVPDKVDRVAFFIEKCGSDLLLEFSSRPRIPDKTKFDCFRGNNFLNHQRFFDARDEEEAHAEKFHHKKWLSCLEKRVNLHYPKSIPSGRIAP